METKERIRCIHVNSAGGLYTLVVGGEAAYSGQDKLTTITEITKVVGIGPHGASYVYRVYCEAATSRSESRSLLSSLSRPSWRK